MSIEQSNHFHTLRRLLRVVAPGFRIMATPQLSPGVVATDMRRRTVEVGEGTAQMQAVAGALIQIGHLRLIGRSGYNLLFGGPALRGWKGTDEALLTRIARQAARADRESLEWAVEAMEAFWQVHPDEARQLLKCYVWGRDRWKRYFS